MLSYHADADIHTNPFELGLDRLVNLDSDINFIGKKALKRIKTNGIKRLQVGLEIKCERLTGPNTKFWPLRANTKIIGKSQNFFLTFKKFQNSIKKLIFLKLIF